MYQATTSFVSNTGKEFKRGENISETSFFQLPHHEMKLFKETERASEQEERQSIFYQPSQKKTILHLPVSYQETWRLM